MRWNQPFLARGGQNGDKLCLPCRQTNTQTFTHTDGHAHMNKYMCTHTQSCRNWLQLAGRWSLSFPHQCRSESLIIKRACLMTAGLTLSDAGTLWYSRGNPTHLHFACPITQPSPFLLVISYPISLSMHWLYIWARNPHEVSFCLMCNFLNYLAFSEKWQLYLAGNKMTKCSTNMDFIYLSLRPVW